MIKYSTNDWLTRDHNHYHECDLKRRQITPPVEEDAVKNCSDYKGDYSENCY